MDAGMLLLTIVLAVAATWMSGLIPAWRACNMTPALQLKIG
jgi:putative ABC transport system permease protein